MRETPNDHSLRYCRWKYQVPAYKGVEVETWDKRKGIIIGGNAGNIKVEFEEKPKIMYYHPTDVKYFIVMGSTGSEIVENIIEKYD